MTMQDKYDLINNDILKETSTDPIEIITHIMKKNYISMHGPEHHYLDGAALLVACYNADHSIDIHRCLEQLAIRSLQMPGAMCGHWGVCGSSASIGAALSVLHHTGPLSDDLFYRDHMTLTSMIIAREGEIGGPRCCKRNAFISLSTATTFISQNYHIPIHSTAVTCIFSQNNNQCLKTKCPFHKTKEQS